MLITRARPASRTPVRTRAVLAAVGGATALAVALAPGAPVAATADVAQPGRRLPQPGQVILGTSVTPATITVRGEQIELGATTPRGVRRLEGRKPNSDMPVVGKPGVVGHTMTYQFRGGCVREYSFPKGDNHLSDFTTDCDGARTFNKVTMGMNVMTVQSLTGFGWQLGRIGPWECPLDAYLMSFGGYDGWVTVWADSLDITAGSTAKVSRLSAQGRQAILYSSLMCEDTSTP